MYDHPSTERCVEFYSLHLQMIMNIRSDLLLYKRFVENRMSEQADAILSSAVLKFDELKKLTDKMKFDTIQANQELKLDVTKTMNYGRIIQKAA